MAYQQITASEVDEDSPITEGLMQRIRDNLIYFLALFDTSTGHDHDNDTDDGTPITSFPEAVTAEDQVTVIGTLTAANFHNYLAIYGGY
jgi:hypothetical protein